MFISITNIFSYLKKYIDNFLLFDILRLSYSLRLISFMTIITNTTIQGAKVSKFEFLKISKKVFSFSINDKNISLMLEKTKDDYKIIEQSYGEELSENEKEEVNKFLDIVSVKVKEAKKMVDDIKDKYERMFVDDTLINVDEIKEKIISITDGNDPYQCFIFDCLSSNLFFATEPSDIFDYYQLLKKVQKERAFFSQKDIIKKSRGYRAIKNSSNNVVDFIYEDMIVRKKILIKLDELEKISFDISFDFKAIIQENEETPYTRSEKNYTLEKQYLNISEKKVFLDTVNSLISFDNFKNTIELHTIDKELFFINYKDKKQLDFQKTFFFVIIDDVPLSIIDDSANDITHLFEKSEFPFILEMLTKKTVLS